MISGGVLLPYQKRWLRDSARVKVMEKSRRIGITWATAAHAVLEASKQNGQDVWYVSYSEDGAKEFIRDVAWWAGHCDAAARAMGHSILPRGADGELVGVRAFQVTFSSGFRVTALTSAARNLRGKQGLVIIDEAAFHDNLGDLLKAAFALLMWGGAVWVMSSHNGVENDFNALCEAIRDGKLPHSLHRVTIEDAIADGLYRRICAVVLHIPWTADGERRWLAELEAEYGDGVREELYCEPARGGQSYLGRPLIEACMVDAPVLRLSKGDDWTLLPAAQRHDEIEGWCMSVLAPLLAELPDTQPHAFGWDFGRYSDRSVLAPFTLTQGLVRRCPFLVELENVPHNNQWQILDYVGGRLPNLFAAWLDKGGNGAWISEQALERWGDQVVTECDLTVKFYAEHMPQLRDAHELKTIAYPRDLDVRNDLGLIRRIEGVPRIPSDKTVSRSGGNKRHGDAAVALLLGYCAASQADAESRRWEALSAAEPPNGHNDVW